MTRTLAIFALAFLPGCFGGGSQVVAPPDSAVCDSLEPHLPTWSENDTDESVEQGAAFLSVFSAVCER